MHHQNKIKICHVTMHYYPLIGGQEIYIKNLNNYLNNYFVVSVLQRYTRKIKDSPFYVYNTGKILKFISKFFGLFLKNSEWYIFNVGLFFSKKILKNNDILICHYPFHYPVLKWHKRVVVLSHGVLWAEKKQTFFDKLHKSISCKLKEKRVFIISNDTHFLREIGYNIKPCTGYFSEISENVWFVPNCVDTSVFVRKFNIKKEKIILVPRNIRPDRGIHLAIEAFNLFSVNDKDYKMLIVGSGKGKYLKYCKYLINQYGLCNRVFFIDHATQEEMIVFYNKSDVTLIPSIEKEGTSLSALESMSCGTATVVTSVAGLLDLPAFKVQPNASAICEGLKYVKENKNSISQLQRDEVVKKFNIELWGKAWIKIISLIKDK